MMNSSCKILFQLSICLFLAITPLFGEDAPYFSVGEIDVPDFMSAAQDFGAYAEKVKPGSSMLIAGGAMALSFKYPGFNLNSGIRVIGYADAKDPMKKSRYVVVATPSGAVELRDRFKSGSTTLFVRKLGDKVLLSDSIDFLNTIKALPPTPSLKTKMNPAVMERSPAIYLKSMPALFLSKAGNSLPSIKSLMSQYPIKGAHAAKVKGDPTKKSASESAMETFFRQCASIETRIYPSAKTLLLHFTVTPTSGSKFQSALKPFKGAISYDTLDEIVSKTIGDPEFRLTKKFNKAVSELSNETGGKVNAKSMIAALPKLQFSARDSLMMVEFNLPSDVLRTLLLDAGFIQKPQPPSSNTDSDSRRRTGSSRRGGQSK